VRLDEPDEARWVHGVVAADRSAAIIALVQLDESMHNRPGPVRVPGLDPARAYVVSRIDPREPSDAEVLLRVSTIKMVQAISQISGTYQVLDLRVESAPLEEIIGELYVASRK